MWCSASWAWMVTWTLTLAATVALVLWFIVSRMTRSGNPAVQ